jgi:hypothetical protein
LPGPGPFNIVYAGTIVGIDFREAGTATFDGDAMVAYEAYEDEHPELGSNTANEVFGDGLVVAGRWAGGTTAGKFYEAGNGGLIDFPANGGFHYVMVNPISALPAGGMTSYTAVASTAATVSDGSLATGTIDGTVAADLAGAASSLGVSLTIDIPGDTTYTIETTGGSGDPSTSEIEFSPTITGVFYANLPMSGGGACAGGGICSAQVDGVLGGANGERIALVVHIFAGSGGAPKSVTGAMVFEQ